MSSNSEVTSGRVDGPQELLNFTTGFFLDVPPRADDIDMEFNVVFHDEQFAYTVTIKLYDHGTDHSVQWAEPLPNVSVTYYTESGEIAETQPDNLKFVAEGEAYAISFKIDLDVLQWKRFLFLGMHFDQQTVKYYNITQQGQKEERIVEETRRVSLSTPYTYARGDFEIWGRRFFGRGTILEPVDT